MNKTILFLSFVFIAVSSFAAESSDGDIQSQMTPEQFQKAGLEKLTPEELAYLSDWIVGKVEVETEKVVAEIIPEGDDRFGADEQILRNVERVSPEQKRIQSRILGNFRGWKSNTIFRLENGQVWKHIQDDKFVVNLQDPVVTIEKGFLGTYFLKVKGYGSRAKVKRIE
ncbi:MAG: hypothetical protein AB3N63_08450 [Puniceicoccaceae bacterium]